jgi:hypothetical protein
MSETLYVPGPSDKRSSWVYGRLGLHVSASSREVVRAVREWIRPECACARKFRDERHKLTRAVLASHYDAWVMYVSVVSGCSE